MLLNERRKTRVVQGCQRTGVEVSVRKKEKCWPKIAIDSQRMSTKRQRGRLKKLNVSLDYSWQEIPIKPTATMWSSHELFVSKSSGDPGYIFSKPLAISHTFLLIMKTGRQ